MNAEDTLYPAGYTTAWWRAGEVRIGWSCLIIDGIAVLTPIIVAKEGRYVVESDRIDFWGNRQTVGHYEYRTVQ